MREVGRLMAGAVVPAICAFAFASNAQSWRTAIDAAVKGRPDARIVIIDVAGGRLLGANHLAEAAHTLAAPGSTLKPLVLYQLLAANRWQPQQRVSCDRKLFVGGHSLACSHPASPAFDAQEALAWSCNSYFAAVARSLQPDELGALLRPTGILGQTGLAPQEAVAEFREPRTGEAAQLALLGVEGVRVTPLELAAAYRWLALRIATQSSLTASQTVLGGLTDSASFGMAGPAALSGVPVAGKTGSAEGIATSRTHGWFAGFFPPERPQAVIVVYMPAGRGADAARVAGELLAHSPLRKP